MRDETVLLKLKKLAHRLSIYILDFDVNTAQSRRSFPIQKINAVVQGMGRVLRFLRRDSAGNERQLRKPRSRRVEMDFPAFAILVAVGKMVARAAVFRQHRRFPHRHKPQPELVCRSLGDRTHYNGFYSCLPDFRPRRKPQRTEVADLLNKQMPLLRHGFLPYMPFELIKKRVFVADSKPMRVPTALTSAPICRHVKTTCVFLPIC